MNSSETVGSATETHTFEITDNGTRFGGDPACSHTSEFVFGEGHDYDESISAYRVSFIYRCTDCGAERVALTTEEASA